MAQTNRLVESAPEIAEYEYDERRHIPPSAPTNCLSSRNCEEAQNHVSSVICDSNAVICSRTNLKSSVPIWIRYDAANWLDSVTLSRYGSLCY